MNVTWIKCKDGNWCNFENLNLDSVTGCGVYIIWHGGETPRVVRIGQGDISERLEAHREDEEILAWRDDGTLYVTWATVRAEYRSGVERYISARYPPRVGERFPDVEPIVVNEPWTG